VKVLDSKLLIGGIKQYPLISNLERAQGVMSSLNIFPFIHHVSLSIIVVHTTLCSIYMKTPVMKTKITIDNLCCNGLVMEKRVERSTPICRTCSYYFNWWLVLCSIRLRCAQSTLVSPTVTYQRILMHGYVY
jgi:hypothetical protein